MFRQVSEARDVQRTRMRTMEQVMEKVDCLADTIETPDGGDGGDGGHIYFRATGRLNSLYDLRRAHFFGNNGTSGMVN